MKIKNKLAVILTTALFGSSVIAGIASAADTQDANKAKRQEIRQQVEAIKKLPEAQRKAKMEELKKKYPEMANHKRGKKGNRMGKMMSDLEKTNPQLAAEIKNIRNLPQDQRKAKFEELKKKYPELANWKREKRNNDKPGK
jgi:asparagine synthetase A